MNHPATAPIYRKARIQRVCMPTVWHAGCGRMIKPGETYLVVRAPGLSDFGVCSECAKEAK